VHSDTEDASSKFSNGETSQLLMVPTSAVLLKFAAMYEVGLPACAVRLAVSPCIQLVVPSGWLLFCRIQPLPTSVLMSSNPSFSVTGRLHPVPGPHSKPFSKIRS